MRKCHQRRRQHLNPFGYIVDLTFAEIPQNNIEQSHHNIAAEHRYYRRKYKAAYNGQNPVSINSPYPIRDNNCPADTSYEGM